MRVSLPIPSVQIILSGPLPKLNNLKPEDVQVILDLSDIQGPGVYTLKPQVLTPADIHVEAVIPEEVQVEVKLPTPTPTPSATPTVQGTTTITPTVTPIPNIFLTPTPTVISSTEGT